MTKTLIAGIGNPYRGDDGAGWAVIEGLAGMVDPSIKLTKLRGDAAELIDLFSQYRNVYLVDACILSGEPGSWKCLDLHKDSLPEENPQTSTHGFGVAQAIALAKNLGALPEKLVLYAIAGNRYNVSEGLSPPVAKGVEEVTQAILSTIKNEN